MLGKDRMKERQADRETYTERHRQREFDIDGERESINSYGQKTQHQFEFRVGLLVTTRHL